MIRPEWYGLYCDDMLIAVKQFSFPPAIWDFMRPYSKENKYDISLLNIVPTGFLPHPERCEQKH